VLDALRDKIGAPEWREKFKGVFTKASAFGDDLVLLKPMTYMNLSGESVQPASAFHKIAPANVLVIHDEIDLPFGDVRLKSGGGHAGNNGIRSVIEHLGTPDFLRIRVGVGRPPLGDRRDAADWVLSDFDPVETAELPEQIERTLDAVQRVVQDGVSAAMNVVNTKK